EARQPISQRPDDRRRWQGDYPGDDDIAGDAPADRGDPARGADADDGAGDRVSGRDRDAEEGRCEERDRAARFGAKALHWGEASDLGTHRMHDAPSAHEGAQRHCGLTADDDPEGHLEFGAGYSLAEEQHGDDAHGFLRIVAAMPKRV